MKKSFTFLMIFVLSFMLSCQKNDVEIPINKDGEKIEVSINTQGISQTELPISKSETDNVLAIQIYSSKSGANEFVPYAKGLFTNLSNISFNAIIGDEYNFVATYIVNASEKIKATENIYGKPFNSAVTEKFEYSTIALENLNKGTATYIDGIDYKVPAIDRYQGELHKKLSSEDATISLNMRRVSFGVQGKVLKNFEGEIIFTTENAPIIKRDVRELNDIIYYSFENVHEAYIAEESSSHYSESLNLNIKCGKFELFSNDVNFERNRLAIVSFNGMGDASINIDFEVPFEEKQSISSDNLFYDEIQAEATKNFWVTTTDLTKEAKGIKWYVNDKLIASDSYNLAFKESQKGEYNIKYVLDSKYSTTDAKVEKEVMVKVYSSAGIYILNEPNMTAAENVRGINKYVFGNENVERFVVGDYTKFGTTNQNIASWCGKLYCVAPYTNSGVALSQFNSTTGEFIKAIAKLPAGQGRVFMGISEELGVITTSAGAYLVTLNDLTINDTPLIGSNNSKNAFVADGYLFIIANGKALAYNISNISTTTEPIELGNATAGFVQTIDGNIWASNGTTFLKINSKNLKTTIINIPDGVKISFAGSPWKQVSWVASTTENIFFFLKDSWGTGKEVYKYDVANNNITPKFVDASTSFNNYMFYSTSLLYDAQTNMLICQTIKGYGDNSRYSGVHLVNATTGNVDKNIYYDVIDEISGAKDMWFPAMMTPIKEF